jgi:ketosteroid isomerase-like protein
MTIEELIVIEEDEDRGTEAANVALLRQLYAAYGRKDAGPLLASLHEDAELTIVAHPAQFAFGGTHRGPAGVARAIALIDRDFEWLDYGARDFIAEGDRVVALTGGVIQHRATGKRLNLGLVDILRISDGRIVELVEFFDTGTVLALAASGQPRAQAKPKAKAARKAARPARKTAKKAAKPATRAKAAKPEKKAKRAKSAVKAKKKAARRR